MPKSKRRDFLAMVEQVESSLEDMRQRLDRLSASPAQPPLIPFRGHGHFVDEVDGWPVSPLDRMLDVTAAELMGRERKGQSVLDRIRKGKNREAVILLRDNLERRARIRADRGKITTHTPSIESELEAMRSRLEALSQRGDVRLLEINGDLLGAAVHIASALRTIPAARKMHRIDMKEKGILYPSELTSTVALFALGSIIQHWVRWPKEDDDGRLEGIRSDRIRAWLRRHLTGPGNPFGEDDPKIEVGSFVKTEEGLAIIALMERLGISPLAPSSKTGREPSHLG